MVDIPVRLNSKNYKDDTAIIKLFCSVTEEYTDIEANDTQIVTVYFKSFKTVIDKVRPFATNEQTYVIEVSQLVKS